MISIRHVWRFVMLFSIIVLLAIGVVLLRTSNREPSDPQPLPPIAEELPAATATDGIVSSSSLVQSKSPLQSSYEVVLSAPDSDAVRNGLGLARAALASMPTNAAVAAIRSFLNSHSDAPTGRGFKLSSNGHLEEAPTWRTFLLDELARLDRKAAAEYSHLILGSKDSPDEWALALRNLAWGGTGGEARALLELKTDEMLGYEPWQQDPSVGYLEAFDVPAFLGGISFVPILSDLIRLKDNPAVAHAAFLSMDRLVIRDAASILDVLLADPGSMQGREETRANYFARADVRRLDQRLVLEKYLLDPRIGSSELEAFAEIYPNANYMISPNLLTRTVSPDRVTLLARDAESLQVTRQWLADPRFARAHPALERTVLRLESFLQQRGQSGH